MIMKKEEMQKFDSGFNEGFLYAAQVVASAIIRSINNNPKWMMPNDRRQAVAQIQLTTRYILQKRKLVPTTYQVMRGQAEDVKLDFNMDM